MEAIYIGLIEKNFINECMIYNVICCTDSDIRTIKYK